MPLKLTAEEIDAGKSPMGGFTYAQLEKWGVPTPPPAGWLKALLAGRPMPQRGSHKIETVLPSSGTCIEAKLLHQVVMAVINAGQNDILKGISDLNEYYGTKLPTVEDVIGGRPEHAIITGEISFDDRVYQFTCCRDIPGDGNDHN